MISKKTLITIAKPKKGPFEVELPPWAPQMENWVDVLAEDFSELRHKIYDVAYSLNGNTVNPVGVTSPTPNDLAKDLMVYLHDEIGYPEISAYEIKQFLKYAEKCLRLKKIENSQAIAIALRQASPSKYRRFERMRAR